MSMLDRSLLLVSVSVMVAFSASVALAQAAEAGGDAPKANTPQAMKSADDGGGKEDLSHRMWWNRSAIVEELNLTAQQRQTMDTKARENFEREKALRLQTGELRKSFENDIAQGHWASARQSAQKLAEAQKAMIESQMNSRIDVLSLLTDEQREKVMKSRARFLMSGWAMGAGGTGGGAHPWQGGRHHGDGGQ